jgi:type II secretory pathway component PulF
MESITLDDFRAWNDQLAALLQAGIPLDIGLDASDNEFADTLKTINATIARRVNRGETLAEALEDDDRAVPSAYRSLVQLGLRSGDLNAGLDGSTRIAESADTACYTLHSAFIYPLILCGFAFVGAVVFCRYFVPSLAGIYSSLRLPPGPGLQVLETLRGTLPYWIIILPLALILWLARRWYLGPQHIFSASRTPVSWLPFVARTLFYERCANFAESLAGLLQRGNSFEESLPVVAEVCGDGRLAAGARSLAASLVENQTPSEQTPATLQFPPFLCWALLQSEATTGRPRALRMAADIYRLSAQRRQERLRIVVPMVVCVVLGGGVTLLYGLSLFVPIVELLRTLATGVPAK